MKLIAVAGLLLLTAACSGVSQPWNGPDPADARARVPAADYRSTIGSYASRRPVEPGAWREQNDRVAPAPRP